MFEFARENDVLIANPCKKSLKSDMGFVLQTGLRTGELIGLKWSDVDFENRTMKIERTMEYRYKVGEWHVGPPKTKNSYRDIPMTNECTILLKELKAKRDLGRYVEEGFEEFVFINRNGTPTKNSTYDNNLAKLAKKAGIENFSMHTLRHTFATRCIEAGMRPKTLQQILGHSSINITMNLYVHVTDDEKIKEIQKFEDYAIDNGV